MDKRIIDALYANGLISKVGINADKYESVDDLFKKGVISFPGSKNKVNEIISKLDITVDETPENINSTENLNTTITEDLKTDEVVIDETPAEETPIDETPETPEVIDETPAEETPIEEPVEEVTITEDVENVTEEVAEETTEETTEEVKPKKTKTKKTE